MKTPKLFLAACALCMCMKTLTGQVISNGDFETWNQTNADVPVLWYTSNEESVTRGAVITTTKSTDSHSGMAARLETKASGTDTFFGYIINTLGDPFDGIGGFPYSQQPDSITGWYKYSPVSGDSAFILVFFKQGGSIISSDMFKIGGTQATYARFSFPLTLAATPDSVIIGMASSDPMSGNGHPGSVFFVDDLAFTGTGITQAISNGSLDNWGNQIFETVSGWGTYGEGVRKSTDKYAGNYAIEMETIDFGGGDVGSSGIYIGADGDGVPYTLMTDTLVFYYKFLPQGSDSGSVYINLKKNGAFIGNAGRQLPAASSYTMVSIPFSTGTAPDTIQINFSSSSWPYDASNAGSRLLVDDVRLKSQPTSIFKVKGMPAQLTGYPNPAGDHFTIEMKATVQSPMVYQVYDVLGRVVLKGEFNTNQVQLDISQLQTGTYHYQVMSPSTGLVAADSFLKK